MGRIADTFSRVRDSTRPGLVAYVTAGDPDLARTAEILVSLAKNGADVLEVGIPFSDPLADGPVIQRASERALASGSTLRGALTMIRETRSRIDAPIVLFTSANPVFRMGEDILYDCPLRNSTNAADARSAPQPSIMRVM